MCARWRAFTTLTRVRRWKQIDYDPRRERNVSPETVKLSETTVTATEARTATTAKTKATVETAERNRGRCRLKVGVLDVRPLLKKSIKAKIRSVPAACDRADKCAGIPISEAIRSKPPSMSSSLNGQSVRPSGKRSCSAARVIFVRCRCNFLASSPF